MQTGSEKRKRTLRACDRCHKLGRKARPKSRVTVQQAEQQIDAGPIPPLRSRAVDAAIPQEEILALAGTYRNTVYPIYCFFHWPTFIADLTRKRYDFDPAFQATVHAVCAIGLARIRDGAAGSLALSDSNLDVRSLRDAARAHLDRVFSSAAQPTFDDLRTASLLTILALQDGDMVQVQMTMALYLGLSAVMRFHDERQWPTEVSEIQKQERRALFWSSYTTDVFTAIMWKGTVRHRLDQSFVAYPDQQLDTGNDLGEGESSTAWIAIWNAVTDLYRCHEWILNSVTPMPYLNYSQSTSNLLSILASPSVANQPASWDTNLMAVQGWYDNLPPVFRGVRPLSGLYGSDISTFQVANLNITLQAVKMCIVCTGESSMIERCRVAGEVLDVLAAIPTACLKVISAPVYHQLASIGSLLGSVVNGPLTISTYIQVRQILLSFANLLASLEGNLSTAPGLCDRLLQHVSRIDAFMLDSNDSACAGHHLVQGSQGAVHNPSSAACPPVPSVEGSSTGSHPSCPDPVDSDSSLAIDWAAMPSSGSDPFILPPELLANWPLSTEQPGGFDFLFFNGDT